MTVKTNQQVTPICKKKISKKCTASPRLDVACLCLRGVDVKLGNGQYFRETPNSWQVWDEWGLVRKYRKCDVVEVK